jgi:4-hydroxy-2-oxoglutarate aldolase
LTHREIPWYKEPEPEASEAQGPVEIRGVIPPIPTPFRPDGSLALKALRSNLERWNQTGVSGYLVLGSNGEAVHLSPEEKRTVLEASREAIPPELLLIAGVGEASTRATVAAAKTAWQAGADLALVITPHFYRSQMTASILKDHFLAVAEESPVPVLLYNVPSFTGINLPVETVWQLAEHENIVGIKDSLGDLGQLGRIIRESPEGFAVLVGDSSVFYPALCLGAQGGILAVACVAPKWCVSLYEAFLAGDHAASCQIQLSLLKLNRLITAEYGIGGLKAALDQMGYFGGLPRQPLKPPEPEALGQIAQALGTLAKEAERP